MVDLDNYIDKVDNKQRKTRRYRLTCDSCQSDRGYGMASVTNKLCKKCARVNDHLDECRHIAESHGGQLLSNEWKGSDKKYMFRCNKCNNEWETYSYVIRRGSWCSICSNDQMASDKRQKNIEYCKNLAQIKGGEFLSSWYKNDATKYDWKCANGHMWSTRLTVIEGGSWCPQCFAENSTFRMRERQLRNIVESKFNVKFPSIRPEWLINPDTGYKMELDCYNEELRLAFEYDGELHDVDVEFFNNCSALQRQRDIIKDKLCIEHGVRLIRISHKNKYNLEKVVLEIIDELLR